MSSSPTLKSTNSSSSSSFSGSLKLRKGDTLVVQLVQGVDLVVADVNGKSDPYVIIDLKQQAKEFKFKTYRHLVEKANEKCLPGGLVNGLYRTTTQLKTLNPTWNDEFQFELLTDREDLTLYFNVYDWDRLTADDPLGDCKLYLSKEDLYFAANNPRDHWINLQNVKSGKIQVQITVLEDPNGPKSLHLLSYNSFKTQGGNSSRSLTKENVSDSGWKDLFEVINKDGHGSDHIHIHVPNDWEVAKCEVGTDEFDYQELQMQLKLPSDPNLKSSIIPPVVHLVAKSCVPKNPNQSMTSNHPLGEEEFISKNVTHLIEEKKQKSPFEIINNGMVMSIHDKKQIKCWRYQYERPRKTAANAKKKETVDEMIFNQIENGQSKTLHVVYCFTYKKHLFCVRMESNTDHSNSRNDSLIDDVKRMIRRIEIDDDDDNENVEVLKE
ncbi:hypothetical protein C9374_010457 [Naegleria lovaniensis]|uniref:C2 domain-containing protein n=1 Tax=Naegleria lovaniensis TaxID=51637 RepID=A0AA88GH06_NAELO|nr:uncharacterized protein C9374_010457 [Naegleria lovaniensis]KAG2374713.1 hypothetical protein C9374_010457 [Naegleria lovaniensis]